MKARLLEELQQIIRNDFATKITLFSHASRKQEFVVDVIKEIHSVNSHEDDPAVAR